MSMPPRVPVTLDQIATVVAAFYSKVRKDPVLGPVFHHTIGQSPDAWRAHEAKIAAFWGNALLHQRSYSGNPMQAHIGISAIEPEMFDIWLGHFDATLQDILPPSEARAWSALAHRIGRGLTMGVRDYRDRETGAVPIFNPPSSYPQTGINPR